MRRLAVSFGIAILGFAGVVGWRWWVEDRAEQAHADRGETELLVGVAERQQTYELYETGSTLEKARLVSQSSETSKWLSKGSFFMTVSSGARTLYYPVPILGYRLGPDRDGGFVVSVRPAPVADPPSARADSPPYAFVPNGHFLLGDRANPREPHYVWVAGFFIGVFEVTNSEFLQFYSDPAGYASDATWTEAGRGWKARDHSEASALLQPNNPEYRRFGQADQPVTSVTWFEAIAYCRWLTADVGGGRWVYSLPDDAEWEKAARGPDGFDYGLGAAISDAEISTYNWKKNPGVPVTVVGWQDTLRSFPHNRYGVYHASGNVAEWTASAFWPYSRQEPYSGNQRNNLELAERRSVRGGSWYSATTAPLYLPYRDAFEPWHRSQDVGFRVVARRVP